MTVTPATALRTIQPTLSVAGSSAPSIGSRFVSYLSKKGGQVGSYINVKGGMLAYNVASRIGNDLLRAVPQPVKNQARKFAANKCDQAIKFLAPHAVDVLTQGKDWKCRGIDDRLAGWAGEKLQDFAVPFIDDIAKTKGVVAQAPVLARPEEPKRSRRERLRNFALETLKSGGKRLLVVAAEAERVVGLQELLPPKEELIKIGKEAVIAKKGTTIEFVKKYLNYKPIENAKHQKEDLDAHTKTTHWSTAADVISHFVNNFVKSDINNITKVDPLNKKWTDILPEKLSPSELLEFKKIINSEEELIQKAISAPLLKAFKRLTERMTIKDNKPNFMILLGQQLLLLTKEHFGLIKEIRENGDTDYKVIQKRYSANLAISIDLGNDSIDSPKGIEYRKKNYFTKLTEQLLSILCPNGEKDLEFPEDENILILKGLRANLYASLKNEILPSVLCEIFKTLLSPHMRNVMLLNALEAATRDDSLNPDSNEVQADRPDTYEGKIRHDNTQKLLNGYSEELIGSLTQMFPAILLRVFMALPFFQSTAGEVVAESIRRQLNTWDLCSIAKVAIHNGLPNWHPGQWQKTALGAYELSPKEKVVSNGKVELRTMPGFKFNIGQKEDPIAKEKIERETKEKLRLKLTDLINGTYDSAINGTLPKIANQLGGFILEFLEKLELGGLLPKLGLEWIGPALAGFIKETFDLVFRKIIGGTLTLSWKVVWHTIFRFLGIKWFWESRIKKQVKKTLSILQDPLHENWLCCAANTIVNELAKEEPPLKRRKSRARIATP